MMIHITVPAVEAMLRSVMKAHASEKLSRPLNKRMRIVEVM